MKTVVIAITIALIIISTGCVVMTQAQEATKSNQMMLNVTSKAFKDGDKIPVIYTGDGSDMSPPLSWSNTPAGVSEYAVIVDDPDAPGGTFTHWVIYRIPGKATGLGEGTPQMPVLDWGAMQGKNSFGNIGYGGPAPPKGKPHHYRFHVYALDAKLDLPDGIAKDELLKAIKGHVMAKGELTGIYGR